MMKKTGTLPKLYLGLLLVLMYVPIILVVIYSFNESKISTIWSGFSWKWYEMLFQDRAIFEALKNSLILAGLSCLLSAIIGTLGAVGLFRLKLRSGTVIEGISMAPIMIPEIVLGMVFLVFFSLLGMKFGMLTLVLAHTSFCVPYIFMMVRSRLVGMDPSMEEAARDLGANEWQLFRDILIPLVTPAILSGMILAFAMSFDDVIISIFVTGATLNTLPIKIYTSMKMGVSPEINALCTMLLIFTFLVVSLSALVGKRSKRK